MSPKSILHLGELLYRALLRKEEAAQFDLLDRLAKRIYPRYKLSEFGRMYLYDDKFISDYERIFDLGNYHSLDRKYMLDQLLKLASKVPGNTAECGVYKGASSYFICRRIEGQERFHRIFDSFEGLSSAESIDGSYWHAGALAAPEEIVRDNLRQFQFATYHRGWIPDCFRGFEAETFSFVHIDVDLYQPTLSSLEFFYDRMEPGGVILCDDSGFIMTCPGARKAVDIFFSDKPEPVIEVPTGQSFIIKQPPHADADIDNGTPITRGSR